MTTGREQTGDGGSHHRIGVMSSGINRASAAKVVVATTVALSFISFLRAAAIVLSDLASSAFYAGGIAERAIGKSAPWFILAVMLFSFAVRGFIPMSWAIAGGVVGVLSCAWALTLKTAEQSPFTSSEVEGSAAQ